MTTDGPGRTSGPKRVDQPHSPPANPQSLDETTKTTSFLFEKAAVESPPDKLTPAPLVVDLGPHIRRIESKFNTNLGAEPDDIEEVEPEPPMDEPQPVEGEEIPPQQPRQPRVVPGWGGEALPGEVREELDQFSAGGSGPSGRVPTRPEERKARGRRGR